MSVNRIFWSVVPCAHYCKANRVFLFCFVLFFVCFSSCAFRLQQENKSQKMSNKLGWKRDNEAIKQWVMNWVWIWDNEAVRKWVMNWVWISDNEAVRKWVMKWVWIWDNEEVTKWVMNWVWIGDNEAVRKWVMNCVWIGDNEAVIFSSVFCAEYDQHLQFAAYKLSVDGQICWKAHPKIRHIPSKLHANQKVYDGKMHTLLCTQRSGWNTRNSVLFYRVKDSKFTLCSVMSL